MWFPIVVRVPFAIAGIIAGWFFTESTLRYDMVQLAISLIMLAASIACVIYGPRMIRRLRHRKDKV
ncbi:MAG: hypothetical protein E6Q76_01765 [Rhizobium sp.]|nr:MAG: hypothetical protein E6Q76_01765 [Rhizobium sp.]